MVSRGVLEAIFHVLRTGIQWKAPPKDFGAARSIHRYFRFWGEQGFFQALWVAGLKNHEEADGIDWTWLCADGCMSKAPLAREAAGKISLTGGKMEASVIFWLMERKRRWILFRLSGLIYVKLPSICALTKGAAGSRP
jgi:transposase